MAEARAKKAAEKLEKDKEQRGMGAWASHLRARLITMRAPPCASWLAPNVRLGSCSDVVPAGRTASLPSMPADAAAATTSQAPKPGDAEPSAQSSALNSARSTGSHDATEALSAPMQGADAAIQAAYAGYTVDPASGFAVDAASGTILVPDGAGGMVAVPLGGYSMGAGTDDGAAAYYGAAGWGCPQLPAGALYDASGMFAMQGSACGGGAGAYAFMDPATGMLFSDPAYGQQDIMMMMGVDGTGMGYGYGFAPDTFACAPQHHAEMMMAAAGLYTPAPFQLYPSPMMAADGGNQYNYVAQAAGLDASSLAAMGFDPFALSYAGSVMGADHSATAQTGLPSTAADGADLTTTTAAAAGAPPPYRPLARLPSMRNGLMLTQQRSLALLGPNEYGDVALEPPPPMAAAGIGRPQGTGSVAANPTAPSASLGSNEVAADTTEVQDSTTGGMSARRRVVDTSGADDDDDNDDDDSDGMQPAGAIGKPGGSALYNASYTFYSRAAGIRALKASPPKLRLGGSSNRTAAVVPLSAAASGSDAGGTDADMPVETGRSGTPRSPVAQVPASSVTAVQPPEGAPAPDITTCRTALDTASPAVAPGGMLDSVSVRSASSVQPTLAWEATPATQSPRAMEIGGETGAALSAVELEGGRGVGELSAGAATPPADHPAPSLAAGVPVCGAGEATE